MGTAEDKDFQAIQTEKLQTPPRSEVILKKFKNKIFFSCLIDIK
jgi:hypothetical protein